MMSLPVWLPGTKLLLGVSVQGVSVQEVSVQGGLCLGEVSVHERSLSMRGLCPGEVSVGSRSRKVGGMHPTGMLSCFLCFENN